MIKRILPFFLLVFTVSSIKSQMNYTVSFPTSTFTALTTGTVPTLTLAYPPAQAAAEGVDRFDEGAANDITLPFTFNFNGVNYTKMHISTNGFIALGNLKLDTLNTFWGSDLTSGPFNGTNNNSRASRPIIAPLWDDLWGIGTGTTTNRANYIRYLTSGTAPNRVLTIQWLNAQWTWQAAGAGISFQVKLYETTNVIDFIYRQQATAVNAAAGASIGLADTAIGYGNFLSMTGVTNTATASFKTETSITTKPASNFTIRFTPTPVPAADAALSNMTAPSFFVSCFNTNKDVSVTLQNKGTSPIAVGAASIKFDVIGANTQTITKTNATSIAPGTSEVVTFNLNLNTPTTTADQMRAVVTLASDTRIVNDSATRSTSTASTEQGPFPIVDIGDFSIFNWLRTIEGNNFWTARSAPFQNAPYFTASLTNPNPSGLGDSIRGNGDNTYYMFVPRATSTGISRAFIYSNCIELPNTGNPSDYTLSFYMTHDSSRPNAFNQANPIGDSLAIMVSNDAGQTWNRVGDAFPRVISGYDVPTYQQDSVSLSAFAGQTVQIAFMGIGAFGNMFGVDDISLGNVALPVKFTAFAGYKEGTKNILEWSTANELNNKGFDVQRSSNGKEFKSMTFVNSKATNGNSSNSLSYRLIDQKPFVGDNYYRLRQVDINGKETFSSIVLIKDQSVKNEISKIYPNPATNNINIVFSSNSSDKFIAKITDLTGKIVDVRNIETMIGENNFNIDITKLSKGNYNIKIVNANGIEIATKQFIKM